RAWSSSPLSRCWCPRRHKSVVCGAAVNPPPVWWFGVSGWSELLRCCSDGSIPVLPGGAPVVSSGAGKPESRRQDSGQVENEMQGKKRETEPSSRPLRGRGSISKCRKRVPKKPAPANACRRRWFSQADCLLTELFVAGGAGAV